MNHRETLKRIKIVKRVIQTSQQDDQLSRAYEEMDQLHRHLRSLEAQRKQSLKSFLLSMFS